MRFFKRGQAALEFLMTYGWAFLVIMIMIGALAYFGVLNVSTILPDRVSFQIPFQYKQGEHIINSADTNTIVVSLTNSQGVGIKVSNISVSTDFAGVCDPAAAGTEYCIDLDDSGTCNNNEPANGGIAAPDTWREGDTHQLIIDCDSGTDLPVGDKVKFFVDLTWYPASASPSFAKSSGAEIMSEVQ